MFGYSIDRFSEFFAHDFSGNFSHEIQFTLGNVEVTIGMVTPLGIRLFDNYHDNDYLPEWYDLHSIRILGASAEKAESYLLNALIMARRLVKVSLRLFPIHWSLSAMDDTIAHHTAPAIAEIEPLRLFYKGLEEGDPASAFLQFYRVLEYYATLLNQDEMTRLRWDRNLDARRFIIEILKATARDERAQLFRIVAHLGDKVLLKEAMTAKLCNSATPEDLANAMYAFRNAVVHAKYDFRTNIHTDPVFESSAVAATWRGIAEELAARSLQRLGQHET
jgi:hypothetical protein